MRRRKAKACLARPTASDDKATMTAANNDGKSGKSGKTAKSGGRGDRLAAALRENLRRRKAQARGRDAQSDEAAQPPAEPDRKARN